MGCFGLTELGYGNNAVQMETTVTYDKETKEFIVNTPTPLAQKYWITNGACHAHHIVVFSQLYIDGVNQGKVPILLTDAMFLYHSFSFLFHSSLSFTPSIPFFLPACLHVHPSVRLSVHPPFLLPCLPGRLSFFHTSFHPCPPLPITSFSPSFPSKYTVHTLKMFMTFIK